MSTVRLLRLLRLLLLLALARLLRLPLLESEMLLPELLLVQHLLHARIVIHEGWVY